MTTARATAPLGRLLAAAAAAFVLFGVAGAVITLVRPVTYRSTAVLTIDQPSELAAADSPGLVAKLVRLRELYGPLLTTKAVVDPVAQRTHRSAHDVAGHVSVTVSPDSLLLLVRATGHDAGAARELAGAAADELVAYTTDLQAQSGVPAARAVTLTEVSPAARAERMTGRPRTVVTVALMLGIVGALAAVVLVHGAGRDRP